MNHLVTEDTIERGGKILPKNAKSQFLRNLNEGNQDSEDREVCVYDDSFDASWLGWVQTPQYFEHCYELKVLGDPCGHRNAVFFDAVQCGLDGYGSAFFAGTNAIFRRAALDSIGGIKYGTLTEDAFTGMNLNAMGWDSGYFRKDWEGEKSDPSERFMLCTGDVPESIDATFKQRKRWAQGSCEIMMMDKEKPSILVDQIWWKKFQEDNPIQCPPSGKERDLKTRFMRFCFFFNAMYYPWHSFACIIYYAVNCYMMVLGKLPFYLNEYVVFYAMVPAILLRGWLNRLASVTVNNIDSQRGQETWFAFSPIFLWAMYDAFYTNITGKSATWANTGGLKGHGSIMELPNIVILFTIFVCWIYSIYRFFEEKDYQTPWQWFPGLFFGCFLMMQLWPMCRMSIQEYLSWSYDTITDHSGYLTTMFAYGFMIYFCSQWKDEYTTNYQCSPYWAHKCLDTDLYNTGRLKASLNEGEHSYWGNLGYGKQKGSDDETYVYGKGKVDIPDDVLHYWIHNETNPQGKIMEKYQISDDLRVKSDICPAGKYWAIESSMCWTLQQNRTGDSSRRNRKRRYLKDRPIWDFSLNKLVPEPSVDELIKSEF